jgi:hypothetical protein
LITLERRGLFQLQNRSFEAQALNKTPENTYASPRIRNFPPEQINTINVKEEKKSQEP